MKTVLMIGLLISSFAHAGVKEVGNGGDICEDRIKIIRDDIESWIVNGGADALTLPGSISHEQYRAAMLDQISKAVISCVDDLIMIGGAEKTCMNFVDEAGKSNIKCNINRFMNETSESDQYVLVHHEYAGLSGFEVNVGGDSDYQISNQISGYLVDKVVKKLAVKVVSKNTNSPSNPADCTADGWVEQCGSLDGKYSVVIDGTAFYKPDFPDGIGTISLCNFEGLLKLNGALLNSGQYQISHQVSSVNGLSAIAPDKSVVQVNAEIFLAPTQTNGSSPWGEWSSLPNVEGAEIFYVDNPTNPTATLYLLDRSGSSFSQVNLVCSLIVR